MPVILSKSIRRKRCYRTGSLTRCEIVSKCGLLVLNLQKPTAKKIKAFILYKYEAFIFYQLQSAAFIFSEVLSLDLFLVWQKQIEETEISLSISRRIFSASRSRSISFYIIALEINLSTSKIGRPTEDSADSNFLPTITNEKIQAIRTVLY